MASTKPAAVLFNTKLKIPRPLAIVLVYILIATIFSGVIFLISQPLAEEARKLNDSAPMLVDDAIKKYPFLEGKINGNSTSEIVKNVAGQFLNISSALDNAVAITVGALNVFVEIISVIIISIYMYLDRNRILKSIVLIFGLEEERFIATYEKIETQLGAWVRGQLFLGFVVGLLTWVTLVTFGINYALPMAVVAGILEIIPVIGPIIAAIPLTLIGFSMSPVKGLIAMAIATGVQQVENHLLVPNVMKKAVGLSPVVTLISILIGSELLGLLGSILAVPVAAILSVLISVYLEEKRGITMAELKD